MKALPARFYGDPSLVVDELRKLRLLYEERRQQDAKLNFEDWIRQELQRWEQKNIKKRG